MNLPLGLKVFYRESRYEPLLLLANAEVHAAFAYERRFEATSIFIATWLDIRHAMISKVRAKSFKVAIVKSLLFGRPKS